MSLTKEQLGHFRRVLEEQRDRANREIFSAQGRALAVGDAGPDVEDEVDQSVRSEAVSDVLQEGTRSTERFADLERALARMDRGEFGVCTDCGESIEPRRLELLPTTERCAPCASLLDRRATPSL